MALGQSVALAEEPSAADKQTARTHYRRGNDLFAARQFADALGAFRAADTIMGVPTTGLKVALVQAKLGRLVEACDTLARVGRHEATPGESPAYGRARDRAKQHLAALSARVPTLRVEVDGAARRSDITLRLSGRLLVVQTPAVAQSVNPGRYVLTLSAPGIRDVQREVELRENDQQTITLAMVPLQAISAVAPHSVPRLGAPTVAVAPDNETMWPLVITGFGVGAAGLLAGAITGGLAMSAAADVKGQCRRNSCPASSEGLNDKATGLSHGATASFVIGGLGATAGIVGLVLPTITGATSDEGDLQPIVGLGTIGVRGRF